MTRGRGAQKSQKMGDIIYGWPLLTKKLDGLFFGISWWCSIWVTNDDDYMVIIYIYFFKSSNYLSIIVCFAPLQLWAKKLRYHMDVDDVLLSDRKKWYTMTSILISKAKNSPLDFNFRSSQNIPLDCHNLFTLPSIWCKYVCIIFFCQDFNVGVIKIDRDVITRMRLTLNTP